MHSAPPKLLDSQKYRLNELPVCVTVFHHLQYSIASTKSFKTECSSFGPSLQQVCIGNMRRHLLASFSTFQASESTLQSAESCFLKGLYLPVNSIPQTQTHTRPLQATFCLSFLSDNLWGQHQRLRWSQRCAGLSRHFQTRWWRRPQTKTSCQQVGKVLNLDAQLHTCLGQQKQHKPHRKCDVHSQGREMSRESKHLTNKIKDIKRQSLRKSGHVFKANLTLAARSAVPGHLAKIWGAHSLDANKLAQIVGHEEPVSEKWSKPAESCSSWII